MAFNVSAQLKPGIGIQPGFNNGRGLITPQQKSARIEDSDGISVNREKNSFHLKPSDDPRLKSAGISRLNPEKVFQRVKKEAGLSENSEFRYNFSSQSGNYNITRYQQYYKGIKVDAGEFVLHEKDGEISYVNGYAFNITTEPTPTLTKQQAIDAAKKHIGAQKWMWEDEGNEKFIKENTGNPNATYQPDVELLYSAVNGDFTDENMRLCYKVNIASQVPFEDWDVYVDVKTGEVVNKISRIYYSGEPGTAITLYSGERDITTESFTENGKTKYKLIDRGRRFSIKNNLGLTNLTEAVDFVDEDNSWNGANLARISNLKIKNIFWTFMADLEIFIEIKDKDGEAVFKSKIYDYNINSKSLNFNVNLYLDNPPYEINVYDNDKVLLYENEDVIESFPNITVLESDHFEGEKVSFDFEISSGHPATDVHWAMKEIIDYYKKNHSYTLSEKVTLADKVIEKPLEVTCYLNIGNDYGSGLPNNAVSNNNVLIFGLGDGFTHRPIVSLDLCAHEFTHSITRNNSDLVYQDESGALNEAFSDIMAACIEIVKKTNLENNWLIGEEFNILNKAWRSLKNPNLFGDPDTYKSTSVNGKWNFDKNNDHGGVHTNCGVINYWFYLTTSGGMGVNDFNKSYNVSGIGLEKSANIAFKTFTTLTRYSTFKDAVYLSVAIAQQEYPNEQEVLSSVINAWYAVGLLNYPLLACNNLTELTSLEGSFDDGSGPLNYYDNRDCIWKICPPGAESIELSFDEFSTENEFDKVIVYDGEPIESNKILEWSGNQLPEKVFSTGSTLTVRFITNNSINDKGWILSYKTIGSDQRFCREINVLTSASGSFNDGSGIFPYMDNTRCQWLISPESASTISITFNVQDFSLGQNDWVYVYDGDKTLPDKKIMELRGKYSEETTLQTTANSGKMLVVFVTDNISEGILIAKGWNASYISDGTPAPCGLVENTAAAGDISDGSEGSEYQNNLDCNWLIKPLGATSVKLRFTELNLETPSDLQNVYNDYIDVFDGMEAIEGRLIKRIVGNVLPEEIASTGGALLVHFHTNSSKTAQGWAASYTSSSEVCCTGTTHMYEPQGTFTDGSGDSDYGNNSDCRWLIKPAGAISIILNFTEFNIEELRDYVTVYDGETINDRVLGHFTRNDASRQLFSSGGAMLVRFRSNATGTAPGWKASYASRMASTPGAGYIAEMQYWFDNDYSNLKFKRILPSEIITEPDKISTEGLQPGFHTLHFRFRDNKRNWSSVNSHVFIKYPNRATQNIQIVECEYWFGDYSDSRKQVTVGPQQLISMDQLDVSDISPGLYNLHIRYRDNAGQWSAINSHLLHKFPKRIQSNIQIVAYQYWFGDDYGSQITEAVSPQQSFSMDQLNVSALLPGLYNLHIRYRDNAGQWSSVNSYTFHKFPKRIQPYIQIAAYQYWFGDDYGSQITEAVSPQQSFSMDQLNVSALSPGLYNLHIRYRDNAGQWSSVNSRHIQVLPKRSEGTNTITEYRYWFDNNTNDIVTQTFPGSENPYILLKTLNTDAFSSGNHYIHFQFKDKDQFWSAVSSTKISVLPKMPDTPVATTATNVWFRSLIANWNSAKHAVEYFLDVSTSCDFSSFLPGYENKNVGNSLSFQVGELNNNTDYYYRVRASADGLTTENSNVISVKTLIFNPPPRPSNSNTVSVYSTGFTAQWDAVAGAIGYYLDVSTANDFRSFLTDFENKDVGNVLSYSISGLNSGASYYFRVRSYSQSGISENTDPVSTQTLVQQQIALAQGWNIISLAVEPENKNLKQIIQPLIDGGKLKKVMDETGKAIEDWGVFGGWQNMIGDWKMTEGYSVNVNSACTLTVEGLAHNAPFEIPLNFGWNIIAWPMLTEQNAIEVFQSLISAGKLKKVMDESGKALEDWGTFGGWQNMIGNLKPGEGYKVNVLSDCVLTITEGGTKSQMTAEEHVPPTHFTPAYKGNGVNHMNIYLVDIAKSGLLEGDEIGVFDGNICVGSVKITHQNLSIINNNSSIINLTVSADDGINETDGFTQGKEIRMKLYRDGKENVLAITPVNNQKTLFEPNGTVFAKVDMIADTELLNNNFNVKCYPNPFSEEIKLELTLEKSGLVSVDILTDTGQELKKIVTEKELNSGIQILNWDGRNSSGSPVPSGIYYFKIKFEKNTEILKIILIK